MRLGQAAGIESVRPARVDAGRGDDPGDVVDVEIVELVIDMATRYQWVWPRWMISTRHRPSAVSMALSTSTVVGSGLGRGPALSVRRPRQEACRSRPSGVRVRYSTHGALTGFSSGRDRACSGSAYALLP
jgi:hypothetical protein